MVRKSTISIFVSFFCLCFMVIVTTPRPQADVGLTTKEAPRIRLIYVGETIPLCPLEVAGAPTLFLFNPNSPDGQFRVAEKVFEVLAGDVPALEVSYDKPGRRRPSIMVCRCGYGEYPSFEFDCPGCSGDMDLDCPKGQSYECVSKSLSVIIQVEELPETTMGDINND